MKSKILSLLAIIAFALGTTACHDDITPNNGNNTTGEGSVNLASLGIEINNAEKVIASSRASVDLSDFIIDIIDSEGATTKTWKYSQMPELFTLPAGDYTVKVRSHDVKDAAWEEPYFVGEKTFAVTNDEITNIGVITCKLSNIKVTIGYTDELRAVMGDDCKVVVSVVGSLEYSADETRAGYFAAVDGSTTLVAEFTGTVQGNTEHLTFTATDVEGGQHRKITFKLKNQSVTPPDETGSISIDGGINISAESIDEVLNGNINVDEENLDDSDRPGKEDGGSTEPTPDPNPDQPGETSDISFTCPTASFDEPNAITGEAVIVNISAVNGIEHLIVTISSTSDKFLQSLSEVNMPTTFDLAYPGDKAEVYASLGLPVGDEVLGATSVDFNISSLVPLLQMYPGTHKFQLSVTDAKSQQLVKTLTFVVD